MRDKTILGTSSAHHLRRTDGHYSAIQRDAESESTLDQRRYTAETDEERAHVSRVGESTKAANELASEVIEEHLTKLLKETGEAGLQAVKQVEYFKYAIDMGPKFLEASVQIKKGNIEGSRRALSEFAAAAAMAVVVGLCPEVAIPVVAFSFATKVVNLLSESQGRQGYTPDIEQVASDIVAWTSIHSSGPLESAFRWMAGADKTEKNRFVKSISPQIIKSISIASKTEMINTLLNGWVTDDDLHSIGLLAINSREPDRPEIRSILDSRAVELWDLGQRTRLRAIASQL